MDVSQIKYFLELKKHEHMSVTAELLNISQPTLSRSISALEAELGVQLFDRVGKRIKLNKQGEEFAAHCEQAVFELEQGIFSVQNSRYDTVGHISVQCYAFVPILLPCISAYSKLNPAVSFTVSQSVLGEQMKRSKHPDLILRSAGSQAEIEHMDNFWVTRPLFQEKCVLLVSKRDARFPPEQTSVDLRDLRDVPFITMLQKNIFFQDKTFALCQHAGFYPKICGQTDNIFFKLHMVQEGLAVALSPVSSLLPDMYSDIRTLTLKDTSAVRTVFLSRQNDGLATESAQDFWEFAIDYFSEQQI